MPKPNKNTKPAVTWAQAFRDIIVRAMDRGQLLPVLFFLFVLALIFKMPESRVYDFSIIVVDGFKDLSLVGWILVVVVCILWAGHARSMRRKHSMEYQRIGGEKSRLQQEQITTTLGSSDNH